MAEETHYERVVRFLREQPPGATVTYHEDTVWPECPVSFGWADACPGDLRTWLSIVPPHDADDTDDPMDMTWPYDAGLEIRFAGGAVASIRIVPDTGPAVEVDAPRYAAAICDLWSDWWRDRLEQAGPGLWRRRVWTLGGLETALADWARRNSGRSDLRFAFDPSPSFMGADRRKEDESYDLGDDVGITGSALDALLALGPDAAAEITSVMKDVAAERVARPRYTPGE